MNIKITPYHLFCILKKYGENIELFHPDLKKQNDYYFVANGIIYRDIKFIAFTISEDDICKPCVYNEDNLCKVRDESYKNINKIIFDKLELVENNFYDFNYIIQLLQRKINFKMINECYYSCSINEKRKILRNMENGLNKLMNKQ